jgi:hypothetical protein
MNDKESARPCGAEVTEQGAGSHPLPRALFEMLVRQFRDEAEISYLIARRKVKGCTARTREIHLHLGDQAKTHAHLLESAIAKAEGRTP